MKLTVMKFALDGTVHLSDVMTHLGLHEDEQREAFTSDVNVSFGDASYTLVNVREFYLKFIKPSFQVSLSWVEFEKSMLDNGVKYINVEG